MWQFEYSSWLTGPPAPPGLTLEAAALAAKRKAAREAGYVREVQNILCLPTGFPALMYWRSPIEVQQSKGRISIITEHDPGNDEPRTIYLNEPTQPADVDPSWNGHSIGHWEGDALVVDTIGFNGRESPIPVPVGRGTHVIERFHLTDAGKKLVDDITFEDAAIYSRPWTATFVYDRMPEDAERMEAVCEVDLPALKALDLPALKDVDPEVARLVDPKLQYNAAGTKADSESRRETRSDSLGVRP